MDAERRILVLDRSALAGNLYRLLFSSIGANVVVKRRFEDLRPVLVRREKVDLAIFNSNALGKKFDEIVEALSGEPSLRRLRKIFLLKEGKSECAWRQRIEAVPGAHVITRPFHPDDFCAEVRRIVEGRG